MADVGRPLKFADPLALEEKINEYFDRCDAADEPYTITGLALALDTSRQTLINYEGKEEFIDAIKRAKSRVEHYAEKKLYTGTPTGPIFALKNFGWSDKQDINHGGQENNPVKHSIQVEFVSAKNTDT
jgi:hypothetical protein